MTLTMQVLISIGAVIFSAGVAYGVVKTSLQKQNGEINDLKDAVKDLGDCDKVVRHYLFAPDGTANYVPLSSCLRGHEKQDERLDKMDAKIDKILEKVNSLG